jgi:hypothetical protein
MALFALVAGALVYLVWPGPSSKGALDGGDPSLLTDRVWLEKMPTAPTQHIHVMLALDEAPLGVFQKGSAYQATLEVFEYRVEDGRIELRFPQSDKKATVRYRARACSDQPPFDLCLELSKNPWGGPTRYYGFADDEAAAAALGELGHRLEHAAIDGPSLR